VDLTIEQRPVGSLAPFAANSRTHSPAQVQQIAASIREFGWTNPVLIDGNGGVIAGHGRLAAANILGITTAPCIVLDHLSDAQKRALVIADNKLALNAGWDHALLESEIRDLDDADFDLTLLGFDEGELTAYLGETETEELPTLASGEKAPFQQMTFTVHDEQAEAVREALAAAKAMGPFDSPNENSNGNALARICETFLTEHPAEGEDGER
jgi:ParB family chromosome partitioning protein